MAIISGTRPVRQVPQVADEPRARREEIPWNLNICSRELLSARFLRTISHADRDTPIKKEKKKNEEKLTRA